MHAPRLRLMMRAGAVMLVTALLVLIVNSLFYSAPAPASAAPSWQEDYPIETFQPPSSGTSYPDGADTPFVSPTSAVPTLTLPFSVSATAAATVAATAATTPVFTETQPPNAFLTENAEQSEGLVTPLASQTSGPTITPYSTATLTGVTPQPTRTAIAEKTNGSLIDWGLFWIGFSLPVLSACGYVLYLLDRRPDLFRRRP